MDLKHLQNFKKKYWIGNIIEENCWCLFEVQLSIALHVIQQNPKTLFNTLPQAMLPWQHRVRATVQNRYHLRIHSNVNWYISLYIFIYVYIYRTRQPFRHWAKKHEYALYGCWGNHLILKALWYPKYGKYPKYGWVLCTIIAIYPLMSQVPRSI